jgi:hypothetical protein
MSREQNQMSTDSETAQPDGQPDLVDLGAPGDDDLERQISAKATRPKINKLTFVLAGLLLIAGGFVAGSLVQKHSGNSSSNAAFPNIGTGNNARGGYFGGGQGFPGAGTGTGNGSGTGTGTRGGGTTGTVKLIDGSTIYVTTASGDTVIVKTSGDTKVSVSQSSTLKSLKAGQSVTIQGQTGSDGSVTASTVTAQK